MIIKLSLYRVSNIISCFSAILSAIITHPNYKLEESFYVLGKYPFHCTNDWSIVPHGLKQAANGVKSQPEWCVDV